MSAAEYIAGFFVIILGFAVSELLSGSARLLRERRKIKFYWPYFLVVPFVFEVLIFWFLWVFAMVNAGQHEEWTIIRVMMISVQILPLAFISYLMFPSEITEGFDLKEFYFDNAKFLLIIVIFLNAFTIFDLLRTGKSEGILALSISMALNVIVIINLRKLHLYWLIGNLVVVNYFVFFEKPIAIQ